MYRGPKAFQRHFSEWRHAHGMRCLGIPNTAHFANITLIEDAVQLWDKLKSTREMERFDPVIQVRVLMGINLGWLYDFFKNNFF